MESNAEMHKKIKLLMVFLIFTMITCYITTTIIQYVVDLKEEVVFVVTPNNGDSWENSWYFKAYDTLKGFFSPTKTLVPVLVILPEKSEISKKTSNKKTNTEQKKPEIAKVGNPQNVDLIYETVPKNFSAYEGGTSEKQWTIKANDVETFFGENQDTAKIDIFSSLNVDSKKVIYPGISGRYLFTVDNLKNDYDIFYDITFVEDGLKTIPMVYRLSSENGYLGDPGKWYKANQLNSLVNSAPMTRNSKTDFTLEWKWREGEDDNRYLQYVGEKYSLKITVYAEAKAG